MGWTRWMTRASALAAALTALAATAAHADVRSDEAAAIVAYPLVRAAEFAFDEIDLQGIVVEDTLIQLSNTSLEPVTAHCYYENANAHCSNTGGFCLEASECCDSVGGCGFCQPGWNEVDFRVRLTPRQPLAWRATRGLEEFPLDGVSGVGIGGSSNAGSRVPPISEQPFLGALKCIAVDDLTNAPIDRNVLKGEATIQLLVDVEEEDDYVQASTSDPGPTLAGGGASPQDGARVEFVDVAKYSAVGIQSMPDGVNGDNRLVLGGEEAEYNGCPNVLILDHFFDDAENPVNGFEIETQVALLPCSQDLRRQIPGNAVVQYIVYNEFEQRFSTSRSVRCLQYQPLSTIDTTQPQRSIFNAGVSGTLTGQTRMHAIGSGLLGVAVEGTGFVEVTEDSNLRLFRPLYSAAFNVHSQGDRPDPDVIVLP